MQLPATFARRAGAACVLAAVVLVASCADGPPFVELRLYSMGTWVDIAVEPPADGAATAALAEIEALLRDFEVDYYAWADGELARLNDALQAGRTATVSAEMAALLEQARRLSAQSGGAFDPAVGRLVELWGFHSALEPPAAPPPDEAIRAWLVSGARIDALRVDGRRVTASVRDIQLDLGGIAKGEAVDRIVDLLRRHGVRNAMVNAGGDLRVIGTRGERPWRIGIQDPREDGVLAVVELGDGDAAFTSGDYERYVEHDGRRMHHILDPRTGYPAGDTRAVTVIAKQGVLADAAATALFVAGEGWRAAARSLAIDSVLRVDASGKVEVTKAMQRRLTAGSTREVDVVAES